MTGYLFIIAGGAVSWMSYKLTILTRSTFETELCALDVTGTEAKWLHGIMFVISVVSRPLSAIIVHCDSCTTIDKISSGKYNIEIKRQVQIILKSISSLVFDRVIAIVFIRTQDNTHDPLTKELEIDVVLKSRMRMRLIAHHNSPTARTQYI